LKRIDQKSEGLPRAIVVICFLLLFSLLLLVFYPTFNNPPRSDYWPLFYHFHNFQELPAIDRIFSVINYDVCGHGTYRPLFHVFLYWLYLLFGANYFWFHAVTFVFYCLAIVLLYLLAREFGAEKRITLLLLTIFAFLFSHFDIVTWTFHLAVIIGFCLFLTGFLLYLKYLRRPRFPLLLAAMLLFLPGLLCYETFILWPFATLILLLFRGQTQPIRNQVKIIVKASVAALAGLFVLYGSILSLSRSQSQVEGLASAPVNFFSPPALAFSLAVSATSIVSGGLTAVDPLLISPGIIHDNIGRGGIFLEMSPILRNALAQRVAIPLNFLVEAPLVVRKGVALESLWLDTEEDINLVLAIAGCLILLAATIGSVWLWKRRRPLNPGPFIFTFFLLLVGTFTLYHGRMATNPPIYILLEFRYQLIPDALLVLLGILGADRLLKNIPRIRPALFLLLGVILVINLVVLIPHISTINQQLAPLSLMLSNIRNTLEDGRVNPEERIYLDDSIAEQLPSLCWNRSLARFMKGSYQWLFAPAEMESFTFIREEADWVISEHDLRLGRVN